MAKALNKDECLSFLLSHIVVDQGQSFTLDQLNLFKLSHLAMEAAAQLSAHDDLISHEVIESLASGFIEELQSHPG